MLGIWVPNHVEVITFGEKARWISLIVLHHAGPPNSQRTRSPSSESRRRWAGGVPSSASRGAGRPVRVGSMRTSALYEPSCEIQMEPSGAVPTAGPVAWSPLGLKGQGILSCLPAASDLQSMTSSVSLASCGA